MKNIVCTRKITLIFFSILRHCNATFSEQSAYCKCEQWHNHFELYYMYTLYNVKTSSQNIIHISRIQNLFEDPSTKHQATSTLTHLLAKKWLLLLLLCVFCSNLTAYNYIVPIKFTPFIVVPLLDPPPLILLPPKWVKTIQTKTNEMNKVKRKWFMTFHMKWTKHTYIIYIL